MLIVVSGLIAQYPFGGVAWDYIGYLTGFRALGHEVYYLEDTGLWPYDPVNRTISPECAYNVAYLERVMRFFGFEERWMYCNAADGRFYGQDEEVARQLMREADILLHPSSMTDLTKYEVDCSSREDRGLRVFIDGDPMFTQVGLITAPDAPHPQSIFRQDMHFTFGLKLGDADCAAPTAGLGWRKTLPCLPLEYWPFDDELPTRDAFTSVLNWISYNPCVWEGKEYGQKDIEFLKMIDLPAHVSKPLIMAMGQGVGGKRPTELLREKGWQILEPEEVVNDWLSYRDFVRTSLAEWSITKHGYVAARTGWFSGRSVCYLAAGRPVILQDTGWTEYLPSGEGLLGFRTMEESVRAIDEVSTHYDRHRRAARALAEKYFDATKICAALLEEIGKER